jgi:hypothetical protein
VEELKGTRVAPVKGKVGDKRLIGEMNIKQAAGFGKIYGKLGKSLLKVKSNISFVITNFINPLISYGKMRYFTSTGMILG